MSWLCIHRRTLVIPILIQNECGSRRRFMNMNTTTTTMVVAVVKATSVAAASDGNWISLTANATHWVRMWLYTISSFFRLSWQLTGWPDCLCCDLELRCRYTFFYKFSKPWQWNFILHFFLRTHTEQNFSLVRLLAHSALRFDFVNFFCLFVCSSTHESLCYLCFKEVIYLFFLQMFIADCSS